MNTYTSVLSTLSLTTPAPFPWRKFGRNLVPGERAHRDDFTPKMLPDGWRPLLDGERNQDGDVWLLVREWMTEDVHRDKCSVKTANYRTRRPLPLPTPDADGWHPWNGGDCPVGKDVMVNVRLSHGYTSTIERRAGSYWWYTYGPGAIVAFKLAPIIGTFTTIATAAPVKVEDSMSVTFATPPAPWDCPDDVPPGDVWIETKYGRRMEVYCIVESGVNNGTLAADWNQLLRYSLDARSTWHPCHKTK